MFGGSLLIRGKARPAPERYKKTSPSGIFIKLYVKNFLFMGEDDDRKEDSMPDRLIFVCSENTSRSIMAETIYKSLSEDPELEVVSRGMVVLFPEPINNKVLTVMENHNLTPSRMKSIQLKEDDFTEHTLVLAMTDKIKKNILESFPHHKEVYTLKEYNGEIGDVKDPYGGTLLDYEDCFKDLVRLIKKTIYRLAS